MLHTVVGSGHGFDSRERENEAMGDDRNAVDLVVAGDIDVAECDPSGLCCLIFRLEGQANDCAATTFGSSVHAVQPGACDALLPTGHVEEPELEPNRWGRSYPGGFRLRRWPCEPGLAVRG